MDWKKIYASKVKSPQEAVKIIHSGDTVLIAHAAAEPDVLVSAMVDHVAENDLKGIHIVQQHDMGACRFFEPGMENHFKYTSLFVGTRSRSYIAEGKGDFTPCFFNRIPNYVTQTASADVFLVTLSTPDEHGYCSYGLSCDFAKEVGEQPGTRVIAAVNPNMPRVMGDNFIHVSNLEAIVESNEPIHEHGRPVIGAVEEKIGENIAGLVRDGDCLQLGIGAIPDAVLKFLGDKRDLGIHSEMISDGIIDLYEKGAITGKKKNIGRGKMVVTFMMGTRRLYDFVHDNPAICMMPVSYVNDPFVISQNDNVVSINSALQIDLMGQVCAEAIGLKQYSAVGGQMDFVRGASASKGGRSIIAFGATTKGGTISKIVPFLAEGAAVTTSRNDVDYIVTEYGIAHLKGKCLRERARELIKIAAPAFREELSGEFEKRFGEVLLV
ncbi:MAG TPA: 4-hydroxybutyrate CoA-transferase [Lachnoclostridium sp.]|jgi:4-hydroxybutyrate CoA-transferase|uniref:acetyl-CoA hydrolase/transferase family protein n=2 Tax=Lacrimispora sp. TaxID=2719234 RepID=UPI000EDFE04A|nr:acetyl-CoA hydrolase/transferase C-terminal domain-containing protein [Lacrimispora sp.]HCD43557.1 4-hydroxybutyrate CoA-transferase [Lachnoclostridium sp.]